MAFDRTLMLINKPVFLQVSSTCNGPIWSRTRTSDYPYSELQSQIDFRYSIEPIMWVRICTLHDVDIASCTPRSRTRKFTDSNCFLTTSFDRLLQRLPIPPPHNVLLHDMSIVTNFQFGFHIVILESVLY